MTTNPGDPTLRQSVGGRWALSRGTLVVLGAIRVLAGVSLNAFPSAADWLLASVFATAALGLVLLVAHVTVLRNRAMRPAPVWVIVIAEGRPPTGACSSRGSSCGSRGPAPTASRPAAPEAGPGDP